MELKSGRTRPHLVVSSSAWLVAHALAACLILPAAVSCGAQPRPTVVSATPSGTPTPAGAVAPAPAPTARRASERTPAAETAPQPSSSTTLQPPTSTPGATAEGVQPENTTSIAGKEALTPAQRKIDSNLLTAIKQSRGEAGDQPLQTGVEVDAGGRTVVDITAFVTPALIDRLKELGAEVLSSSERFRSIRARVALSQIETLAEHQDVIFIQPKQGATMMP